MWYVVRLRDGLICSLPTDKYRAEGIALYLLHVTEYRYVVRYDPALAAERNDDGC